MPRWTCVISYYTRSAVLHFSTHIFNSMSTKIVMSQQERRIKRYKQTFILKVCAFFTRCVCVFFFAKDNFIECWFFFTIFPPSCLLYKWFKLQKATCYEDVNYRDSDMSSERTRQATIISDIDFQFCDWKKTAKRNKKKKSSHWYFESPQSTFTIIRTWLLCNFPFGYR